MISNIVSHTSRYNQEIIGYTFTMNDNQKIRLKISAEKNCCEKFGVYVDSPVESFIGAKYQGIDVGPVEPIDGEEEEKSRQIIIHIHTDMGTISIRFYNIHNGYYKHDVSISYFGTSYYVYL